MKRKKFPRTLLLFSLILVFSLSSCSFVRIQNIAATTATVSVRVPDSGKAYVRTIRPGAIVDVFSSHGGSYTITMIAGERYLETLNTLRSQIETRLFKEGKTLTAEEVTQLAENLKNIDKLLEQTKLPGATCSGYVPDFDTVVVVISFDEFNTNWSLSCGSGSD